jgi:hypothetical protein
MRPHLSSIVLAASLTVALFVTTAGPPAAAAAKPSIRGVAIYSRNFQPITAIVFGASRVVVCVSRKCKEAFRLPQAGIWTMFNPGVDLKKGQSREVIVFAASATGEVSFLVRRVIVH